MPVHDYDRRAPSKNAASDALHGEQREPEAGEAPNRKTGASLILTETVPGDHTYICILFACLVGAGRGHGLLATGILYRAAAELLRWVPQTTRPTNKKGGNAQGIRYRRHLTSPVPRHGIARPNANHADEGRSGTHRHTRGSSDAGRQ